MGRLVSTALTEGRGIGAREGTTASPKSITEEPLPDEGRPVVVVLPEFADGRPAGAPVDEDPVLPREGTRDGVGCDEGRPVVVGRLASGRATDVVGRDVTVGAEGEVMGRDVVVDVGWVE